MICMYNFSLSLLNECNDLSGTYLGFDTCSECLSGYIFTLCVAIRLCFYIAALTEVNSPEVTDAS